MLRHHAPSFINNHRYCYTPPPLLLLLHPAALATAAAAAAATASYPCAYDGFLGRYCEVVTEEYCANQCNGHGTCVTGYCKCHDGWYGHDCARKRAGLPLEKGEWRRKGRGAGCDDGKACYPGEAGGGGASGAGGRAGMFVC